MFYRCFHNLSFPLFATEVLALSCNYVTKLLYNLSSILKFRSRCKDKSRIWRGHNGGWMMRECSLYKVLDTRFCAQVLLVPPINLCCIWSWQDGRWWASQRKVTFVILKTGGEGSLILCDCHGHTINGFIFHKWQQLTSAGEYKSSSAGHPPRK